MNKRRLSIFAALSSLNDSACEYNSSNTNASFQSIDLDTEGPVPSPLDYSRLPPSFET